MLFQLNLMIQLALILTTQIVLFKIIQSFPHFLFKKNYGCDSSYGYHVSS